MANRIKEIREKRMVESSTPELWTQEGLARRLGVSRQTVISMEKGTYNPSLLLAFKLAHVFEMRIEEIFSYGGDMDEA
ncbi:MAG: transcriptional regulator [Candidatus Thorarchaeota archaeon]|nr:transcriptional regulator [Candidatus Thorarchaeota archaeon]